MVTRLGQVARVALHSPLPQLDRLFDYEVPQELSERVSKGIRVRVPFGRSKGLVDGFVVDLSDSSEFQGKLSQIAEIVSDAQVLDTNIYTLCRSIADRQAATLSDALRLAIPDRSVAVEKKWLESLSPVEDSRRGSSKRQTQLANPVVGPDGPVWVSKVVELAHQAALNGTSTIIVVPDFRDHSLVLDALGKLELDDFLVNYSTSQTKSKRYAAFLACLSKETAIVIGSRSAIYAPVRNLSQIIIWDDADASHQEPSSPYIHTREVALLRQQVQQCDVHILGHSRSTEVARLLNLKFFEDVTQQFPIPKIANSDSAIRVDSLAWQTIRSALDLGAVLVQVAGKGTSGSAYCSECNTRASCKKCHGPIWIDARNMARCRWCNAGNLDHICHQCGSAKIKQGRAGSSRTAAEFGKAFPGARVIEATGDNPILLAPAKSLVIATPGAEPMVVGGYAAVIILDANSTLSKDTLRATEDAVRSWANAIALLSPKGRGVVVGLSGALAQKFSLWSMADISNHELATRAELRFPPSIRLGSIGAEGELMQQIVPLVSALSGVEVLGPISIQEKGAELESRILMKYEYSTGAALAETIKSLTLKMAAGQQRFNPKSGRAMRPIRVKMDDQEVI